MNKDLIGKMFTIKQMVEGTCQKVGDIVKITSANSNDAEIVNVKNFEWNIIKIDDINKYLELV